MGIISTNKGDFIFRSADDAIKFVQAAPQEESDIWISGEQPYPCLSVCINGKYAAVHFFKMMKAIRGCPIMIKIKRKLLLLQAGTNGNPMSMRLFL